MKWCKRGIVWKPSGDLWWARSHATCPTPWVRRDGSLRVFVQCRDGDGIGRVGWVDLDPTTLSVMRSAVEPVLDVGRPGCFDDNGVMALSVVAEPSGRLRLYYVGFELSDKIRYRLLTGVALSDDDGDSFSRYASTPVLERSEEELYFRCGPFVTHADGRYRMWYVAGSAWEEIDGKAMPVYDIRYLESDDGLSWPAQGEVVLSPDVDEHGFGRPFVRARDAGLEMFYSVRKRAPRAYRLGYAVSADGRAWQRDDARLGIDVSEEGFDSNAMSYSAVTADGAWCFYNGNDFGVDGFAVAERVAG